MNALAKDRNTPERENRVLAIGVAAAATCFAGGLACINASGYAVPGSTSTSLVAVGRFESQVDNTDGENGDLTATIKTGCFRFANSSSSDEITIAEIGQTCFIVDDQTVAKTNGTNTRSVAGRVVDVDTAGVWVDISPAAALGSSLVAANNLDDVGSAATARANLGVAEAMGTPTITVGSETDNAINVAIQLKDAAGDDLAVRGSVFAYFSDDANGDSIAGTAPTSVAIGADGLAIPVVTDKAFQLVSESDGDIDIDVGESGTDTWYLILVMPDGKLVASDAITFA